MSIFKYLRNLTLKTAPCPRFGPSFGFVSSVSSAPWPLLTQSYPIASAGCRTWWSCCRWWGWGGRWRGRQRWRRSSRAPCPSRWQGWRPRIPPGAGASASEIALHVPSIMIKCTLIRAAGRHSFSNDSKSPNSSFFLNCKADMLYLVEFHLITPEKTQPEMGSEWKIRRKMLKSKLSKGASEWDAATRKCTQIQFWTWC